MLSLLTCDFSEAESLHREISSPSRLREEAVKEPPHPSSPRKPTTRRARRRCRHRNGHFQANENKTGKRNGWFFSAIHIFFFFFGGHSLLRKKKSHLTTLLRFMSSGRTLTSQTTRWFCLLNQLGFLRGSGRRLAHERLFFFFLVHHQILHPQWAWKVNNSDLAWLSSLPLSHCSVNTRGLYRRPAEVKRANKSEALEQL